MFLLFLAFFDWRVSADSTMVHNASHYLPYPDYNTFVELIKQSTINNHSLHSFQHHRHKLEQYEAYRRLHYVEPVKGEAWWAPIEDVLVSFPIDEKKAIHVKDKYIVGPNQLESLQKDFILYAAGIANQPEFEEAIAGMFHISVHAFDCTIPSTTILKNNVEFHHWCLGRNSNNDGNNTANSFENNAFSRRSQNKTFVFHTLSQTKEILKHQHIHILKMDIEGFEWDILQKDIIENPNSDDLPDQLLVEVHAVGAAPRFVPFHLTWDKSRRRVNEMVLGMWKRGYRVVYKFDNPVDRHCADLTFLRVYRDWPDHRPSV
eukprot:gene11936-13022_t